MRLFRFLCAALFLLAPFSTLASTTPGVAGTASGFPLSATCGRGEALVGLEGGGSNTTVISQLALICVAVDARGTWTGTPHYILHADEANWADAGSVQKTMFKGGIKPQCAQNSVVQRADWWVRDDVAGGGISRYRLHCMGAAGEKTVDSWATAFDGVLVETPACPQGTWATGISSRSGSFVHAAGLLCGEPDPTLLAIQERAQTSLLAYAGKKGRNTTGGKMAYTQISALYQNGPDGVLTVDHSTGERRAMYFTLYGTSNVQKPKDQQKVKDPYTGSPNFCCLHGLADGDGRTLLEPMFSDLAVVSPNVVVAAKPDKSIVMVDLRTGQQKPLDATEFRWLDDDLVMLVKRDGEFMTITPVHSDGSLGQPYRNVKHWVHMGGGNTLLQVSAPGTAEHVVWMNIAGEMVADTPMLDYTSDPAGASSNTLQAMVPLGPHLLSSMKRYPNLEVPLNASGTPMALPEHVVGVIQYTLTQSVGAEAKMPASFQYYWLNSNQTGYAWMVVEQKGDQLLYYPDRSAFAEETLARYAAGELKGYRSFQRPDFWVHFDQNRYAPSLIGERPDGRWELTFSAPGFEGRSFATAAEATSGGMETQQAAMRADAAAQAKAWAEYQALLQRQRETRPNDWKESYNRDRQAYLKRQAEINYAIDNAGREALARATSMMDSIKQNQQRINQENCAAWIQGRNRVCGTGR